MSQIRQSVASDYKTHIMQNELTEPFIFSLRKCTVLKKCTTVAFVSNSLFRTVLFTGTL